MKNLKIRTKLFLAFGLVILASLVLGFFAIFMTRTLDNNYRDLINYPLERRQVATELKFEYVKTKKSTIATELMKEGIAKWQRLWGRTNKGALCRSFLPSVEQILQANLPISPAFTAMVSGHGKTKSYLHRFGIIDSQTCPCKGGDQTTGHLIHHCSILEIRAFKAWSHKKFCKGHEPRRS